MIADIKKSAEQKMGKSVETLKADLGKVRTGRAHTGLLDHLHVVRAEEQFLTALAGVVNPQEKRRRIGHAFIEHRIFVPVLWIDRFFADNRDLEAERARSFLQWRQELRFTQDRSTPGYTISVNANLKFPGINAQLPSKCRWRSARVAAPLPARRFASSSTS